MGGRFYVYELIDPRDSKAFYIGKGQKSRVTQHEAEAKKGKRSSKCDRIRDIWAAGLEIERRIVERFDDEMAAYELEHKLVAEYPIGQLTNVIPGGFGPMTRTSKTESRRFLKSNGKAFAKIILSLRKHSKVYVLGIDVTENIRKFLKEMLDKHGFEAMAEAVRPHGLDLVMADGKART